MANERKSKITVEICNKIYNKLEDIDSPDFLDNLQTTQIYILRQIAILLRYGGTITTGDLYRFHDISIRRMGEDPQKVVSQRTILSSIKYFESLGIITTWNVSKGRQGYGKNIKLNMDPENLLMAIGDLI